MTWPRNPEGDDQIGTKIKTQKILGPKCNPPKIPCRISKPKIFPESRSSHNTSFVLLYSRNNTAGCTRQLRRNMKKPNLKNHKNPYFNQATPKNTCQHFLTQKNPDIENFKPKNILWSSLSLEIPSTPQPWNSEIIQLKWWQKAQKWDESETAKRKSTNTIHRKGTWLPSQHEFGLTWWPCAGFEPGQESTHEEI